MTEYYDVVLKNKTKNTLISYLADAFSVNKDGVLKIESKEFGNVVVQIKCDEELEVNEIKVKDEYDVKEQK